MLKDENIPYDSVEHSNTLAKGLALLTEGQVDAILLDLDLPDSQGLATFERMHAAANQVPIVILTGFNDEAFGLEAVRRGAEDFLVKGKLDGALLAKAINYAVERKKLDEAVKRQADLIDLSPDAIIIKKPDDTVTFWSLGAEKLYGYTKEQAIGQKTSLLFKTKCIEPLEKIEEKLRQDGKWVGELYHRTKHGREIAIKSYWLAKFDGKKQIIEIFEQNVDITDQKNAERLAAIGATAGMVGHDIRNPLQTITGELFLARETIKGMPNSESKTSMLESLDIVDEQIGYVNKIVSDLQDYARPLQPKLEQVDLSSMLQNLISSIKLCDSDRITVKSTINPGLDTITTDKIYLQRILQNLINNSIQAMPKGGQLTITATRRNNKVEVSVEDTGDGIPEEIRTKMFTPLVTMKSKGQGFGLAVVKRLTEALGGIISFETEICKGTKFTITLPA